ncbi:MAG: hypothetical protein KAY37_16890 [Phycisphaerae bacterium]|nr:hypothetical protein [Phycisphaerae bacterium]
MRRTLIVGTSTALLVFLAFDGGAIHAQTQPVALMEPGSADLFTKEKLGSADLAHPVLVDLDGDADVDRDDMRLMLSAMPLETANSEEVVKAVSAAGYLGLSDEDVQGWDPPRTHFEYVSQNWDSNFHERSTSFEIWPPNHLNYYSDTWYDIFEDHNAQLSSTWPPNHHRYSSMDWGPSHRKRTSLAWPPNHSTNDSEDGDYWNGYHRTVISASWYWGVHDGTTSLNVHQEDVSAASQEWPPNHLGPASRTWFEGGHDGSVSIENGWPPNHRYSVSGQWDELPYEPPWYWPPNHNAVVSETWFGSEPGDEGELDPGWPELDGSGPEQVGPGEGGEWEPETIR